MIKIMFVCHGNICRSPMAEFIMKKLVGDRGFDDGFYISSSATSTEEIRQGRGNPIYPPAQRKLTENGIEYDKNKRAVLLTAEDYEKYDLFIGMDSRNIVNMNRILKGDKDGKIHKLMDFTESKGADVADPWYSGDFERTYRDIYLGCKGIMDQYIKKPK